MPMARSPIQAVAELHSVSILADRDCSIPARISIGDTPFPAVAK